MSNYSGAERTGSLAYANSLRADGGRPERILAWLQRVHAVLAVAVWPEAVPRPRMSHQSIIVRTDATAAQLAIDCPYPADFYAEPGDRLALRAALGGDRHVAFSAEIAAADRRELLLQMPATIDWVQRRRTPRLRCSNRLPALVEFGLINGRRYSAVLEDVSAAGARISLTGSFAPQLAVGSRICELSFEVDGQLLQCRARVQRWHQRGLQVEAGLALTGLEPRAQRRLERLSLTRSP